MPVSVMADVTSDLYLLSLQPKPDLAISNDDITLSPPNPAPGQTVSIAVRVHNVRSLAASNVLVRLYDGNPAAGGATIATGQFSPTTLAGGATVAVGPPGAKTVEVSLMNIGSLAAASIPVEVRNAPPGDPSGRVLASVTVAALAASANTRLTFTIPAPASLTAVWVTVNPTGSIPETRRDNNTIALHVMSTPYAVSDVAQALRLAAGLVAATEPDVAR